MFYELKLFTHLVNPDVIPLLKVFIHLITCLKGMLTVPVHSARLLLQLPDFSLPSSLTPVCECSWHLLPHSVYFSFHCQLHTHTLPPTIELCIVTCSVSQFKHHCLIKVYWTAPTTRYTALCHMMGLLKVVPAHISHVEEKVKLTGHFTNWQVLKCPSPTNGKFFRPLLNVFISFTAYQRNSLSF